MFYKETNLKETSIGEIPNDWNIVRLGDENTSKIIMGQSPPSSTYNKEKTGLPFLQGKMEFREIYPSTSVYCSEPIKIAEPNDVLFSVRAPVGDVNLAPYRLCIGRGLAVIRFNGKVANHLFYFYYFQKIKKRLKALGKGSTFKAINKDDLKNLLVPLPSLSEQQAVVGVLGVVDSVIAKTGEVIAKTERLKKGLMQTLLTRGIGHKEYKYSKELRHEIPKDWEVKTILDAVGGEEDAIVAGPFGSNLKVVDYRDEGVPIIRLQNIEYGRFINKDIKYISPEKAEELRYHSFLKEDIVLAKLGAPIGKTCIVPDFLERGIVVADVVRIRVNEQFLNKKYAMHILNSFYVYNQLNRETIGTTRPRVNLEQVRKLFIPIPSLPEQQKIAEALSAIDEKSELERKEKEKLENIKQGLMDLLLTGKIRVKVD